MADMCTFSCIEYNYKTWQIYGECMKCFATIGNNRSSGLGTLELRSAYALGQRRTWITLESDE